MKYLGKIDKKRAYPECLTKKIYKMKLSEILNLKDIDYSQSVKIINDLKAARNTEQPDIAVYKNQLDVKKHDVFNRALRPDKKVIVDKTQDEDATQVTSQSNEKQYKIEHVARIGIALQKLIVKRAVSFAFGNPVELKAQTNNNQTQEQILKSVKEVLKGVKEKSLNRRVAMTLFSCTEVAECWYSIPQENMQYGFSSKYKLRCTVFSPLLGDTLYPVFDDSGDMVAFSREFSKKENGKTIKYFETYTDSEHLLWILNEGTWNLAEGYPKENGIDKIPIIYGKQPEVEWGDVQDMINRLEKLLSNFADTNDYHGSPKILVKGEVEGFSQKGETGAIIEVSENGDAKYLEWEKAPESIKLEIQTLLNLIYTITQTPDISFDSVKGLGTISGIALKLMFMDAHLKVADHQEVLDEYLQRRINIIKAYLKLMNTKWSKEIDNLSIEPIITPYMIDATSDKIDMLVNATGGKPVISQKAGSKLANLVDNPEEDYKQMQKEAQTESYSDLTNPTI